MRLFKNAPAFIVQSNASGMSPQDAFFSKGEDCSIMVFLSPKSFPITLLILFNDFWVDRGKSGLHIGFMPEFELKKNSLTLI